MADVPFRAGGFTPRSIPFAGAATLVLLLAAWQAAASYGLISTRFLPPPLAIARALATLAASGELWAHLAASLQRFALGWAMGTAAGLVAGFAIGLFTLARTPGMAVVSALFPLPNIALAPPFITPANVDRSSPPTACFGL